MSSDKLSPEAFYARLGRLIEQTPDLTVEKPNSETLTWLAQAIALVEHSENTMVALELRMAAENVGSSYQRWDAARKIELILRTSLARAELSVPVSSQGAFIPAGNTFDAFVAVGKAFDAAKNEVFILDAYANDKIFDFITLVPETVSVRVLSDSATVKSSLKPAAVRWAGQMGTKRTVEIRLSPARALHDRLIVIDKSGVWSLGQSFKDMAERAHTSLVRVDAETAALKVAAYETMWTGSTAL